MNTILLLQTGSPVDARKMLNPLAVIIVVLIIAVAIALFFLITRYILSYKNSPAYLEKKKRKPTTAADLAQVSKECGLVREEKDILWKICQLNKSTNLLFTVREIDTIEPFIRQEFDEFNEQHDEESKSHLFNLRRKLYRTYKQSIIIKNSRAIEPETVFTFTATKGFHHKLILKESSPDSLVLSVPASLAGNKDKPDALSKIKLVFEARDGTPFEFETRVVRYQMGRGNEEQIIAVHTDKIIPLQKRQAERIELQLPCKFRSVNVTAKGGKKEKIHYEPAEKEYDGTLEDISTGGCRVITNLPIKADQYIYLSGPFNGTDTDSAIGAIVRTTKRIDNVYILHVRFIKIEIDVVNRIQARVCGYDY